MYTIILNYETKRLIIVLSDYHNLSEGASEKRRYARRYFAEPPSKKKKKKVFMIVDRILLFCFTLFRYISASALESENLKP